MKNYNMSPLSNGFYGLPSQNKLINNQNNNFNFSNQGRMISSQRQSGKFNKNYKLLFTTFFLSIS